MSPFSLHKPIFNLLSLTPHQLHYFSCSGQNLRVMFVWIVFFSELYLIPVPLPCLTSHLLANPAYLQDIYSAGNSNYFFLSTNPTLIQATGHLLPVLLDRFLGVPGLSPRPPLSILNNLARGLFQNTKAYVIFEPHCLAQTYCFYFTSFYCLPVHTLDSMLFSNIFRDTPALRPLAIAVPTYSSSR